jgi:hypothetical protein
MLAKQHRWTPNGALLTTVSGSSAHEAMPSTEEQISVSIQQPSKGIEHVAVDHQGDSNREGQILVKDVPMGVVISRHGEYGD